MQPFKDLSKLIPGDAVAILSPCFGAPAAWPHVHALGLRHLQEQFKLVPVEFPTTRLADAPASARAADLIAAFTDPAIKAVIATIGGDDQVTYAKHLSPAPFMANPKPFFGFSDNTHFANFLWLNGIPSFYGGSLFTQYATGRSMDPYTVSYLRHALFEGGMIALHPSEQRIQRNLRWNDPECITMEPGYVPNEGWFWDGDRDVTGRSWGGCLESVDELLRHGITIPCLDTFKGIVLILETSEETPSADYVFRFFRALGERGILERVQAVLVGRPQVVLPEGAIVPAAERAYTETQRETVLRTIRTYNPHVPVVQNMDFGHTNPQVCMPYGRVISVSSSSQSITADF